MGLLGLGLVGCSDPPSPSKGAVESAPATATPKAAAASDPDAIPEDWVWVTDTRGRFEVAMPALPRSLARASPVERTLVARRGDAAYRIAGTPAVSADPLAELRASLDPTAVRSEASWQTDGLAITLGGPHGEVQLRSVVRDQRLYVLDVTNAASVADAERFFASFSPREIPRVQVVDAPERGYRLRAPARMGAWRDVSGLPPLVGHRGVLDGHQLAVHSNDLLLVPDPVASLDGAVTEMRRSMNGRLVEIDPRPHQGTPSRRVEFRAGDGMYATVRGMLDGTRLIMAAVYSPSGEEAPWADAYVDSLSVE